jgi:hypothetical protein
MKYSIFFEVGSVSSDFLDLESAHEKTFEKREKVGKGQVHRIPKS